MIELVQRKIIGHFREAIRLFDEDQEEAAFQYRLAYNMVGAWARVWGDAEGEFYGLEHEIMKIWRAYTPQKRGRYVTRHVALGYSSIPVDRWVDDKVQPPRQTVDEALSRFDALVAPWVQSIVEKLEPKGQEGITCSTQ